MTGDGYCVAALAIGAAVVGSVWWLRHEPAAITYRAGPAIERPAPARDFPPLPDVVPPMVSYVVASRRALDCACGVIDLEATLEGLRLVGRSGAELTYVWLREERAPEARIERDAMLAQLRCPARDGTMVVACPIGGNG